MSDFLIIGAQKGGTTSLFHYLSQHPDIYMPQIKEIHFFDNNYGMGINWYLNHFKENNSYGKEVRGEASPYYLFHPLVPERVKKHLPKVKIIIMLRNPVDRAFSQYIHERKLNFEHLPSFDEAVEMEAERIYEQEAKLISGEIDQSFAYQHFSYIARGLYYNQISRWLKFFSFNQTHFIRSEDFFTNTALELKNVHDFLEVSHILPEDLHPQNTNFYQKINDVKRSQIGKYFFEDSNHLANLIGNKFKWD